MEKSGMKIGVIHRIHWMDKDNIFFIFFVIIKNE